MIGVAWTRSSILAAIIWLFVATPVWAQGANLTAEQKNVVAAYEKQLAAHRTAMEAFERDAGPYWKEIADKQALRRQKRSQNQAITPEDFVKTHPPRYAGPPAPKKPDFLVEPAIAAQEAPPPTPVVADFLAAAKQQYRFQPRMGTEAEYMAAFARAALASGISAEQAVGVYALETGGIGPFSRQSGVFTTDDTCRSIPPRGTPSTSLALGYAQLLPANTANVLRTHIDKLTAQLTAEAASAPAARAKALRAKAAVMRKMVADMAAWVETYKGTKNNWLEYVTHGRTPNGLAIHALLLDLDVGPAMQVLKLLGIVDYAARRGITGMDSSRLELINLVGDARGVEALTPEARDASSANFFDRGGYERNPVGRDRSASGLLARLAEIIERNKQKCGAKLLTGAFTAAAARAGGSKRP